MATRADVALPRWATIGWTLAALAGLAAGLVWPGPLALKLCRCVFLTSAGSYAALGAFDYFEHLRLEKLATGRAWSFVAIPVGETINHAITTAVLVAMMLLARRIPAVPEPRDLFVLVAPLLLLVLGWHDEVAYHRHRCEHREDLMHAAGHLAFGVMVGAFLLMRLAF